MRDHNNHDQTAIAELWTKRWAGETIGEMKASIEAMYGPFPLLFQIPPFENYTPGVVMTGLVPMPGVADKPELPFLGAAVVGYLPVQGHDGTTLKQLGNVKGPRWDDYVKPAEVERPEMVSGELPEPAK